MIKKLKIFNEHWKIKKITINLKKKYLNYILTLKRQKYESGLNVTWLPSCL